MQKYVWKGNQANLYKDNMNDIHLMINSRNEPLPYLLPQTSRMLVGVSTNPNNDNSTIYALFDIKLEQYIATLQPADLLPMEIWQGFQSFWWPSICSWH